MGGIRLKNKRIVSFFWGVFRNINKHSFQGNKEKTFQVIITFLEGIKRDRKSANNKEKKMALHFNDAHLKNMMDM